MYGRQGDGSLVSQTYQLQSPVKSNYIYHSSKRNTDGDTTFRTTQIKYEFINDTVYHYTYDNMGNITKIRETVREGDTNTASGFVTKVTYEYDALGQLTRENNAYLGQTITYSYDAGGNITSRNTYAYTTDTLGTATATVSYAYDDANWKDKLTSYNGQAITYDAIGNPTTYYNGNTFTWNGRQMLTANLNGISLTNKYDANGLRTSKVEIRGRFSCLLFLDKKQVMMYYQNG